MTTEELMIKLKADTSQVGPELESLKQKVAGAAGESQKSFISAGSATRSFKKLLSEVTEQSPILGAALKLALNPIVGVIGLGVMALHEFRRNQEKTAEEAKKHAQDVREAWTSAQEAIYSKDPSKAFGERSKGAAGAAARSGQSPMDETVYGQAKDTPFWGHVFDAARGIMELFGDDRQKNKEDEIAQTRDQVARATYQSALKRTKAEADKDAKDKQDRADIVKSEDAQKALLEYGFKVKADHYKAEEEFYDEVESIWREVVDAEKKRRDKAEKAAQDYMGSYMPTVDELAKQGSWSFSHKYHRWSWNPTGLAQQAQYIQWLENGAKQQFMSGDAAGARETIFGKGGIRELKQQLVDAGIIKPDAADILSAVTDGRGALKVNIVAAEGAE